MKVGDKLICKKEIEFFKKGSKYTIESISDMSILIGFRYGNFWFNAVNLYGDSYLVCDYFYMKKELRKLKLDKLW